MGLLERGHRIDPPPSRPFVALGLWRFREKSKGTPPSEAPESMLMVLHSGQTMRIFLVKQDFLTTGTLANNSDAFQPPPPPLRPNKQWQNQTAARWMWGLWRLWRLRLRRLRRLRRHGLWRLRMRRLSRDGRLWRLRLWWQHAPWPRLKIACPASDGRCSEVWARGSSFYVPPPPRCLRYWSASSLGGVSNKCPHVLGPPRLCRWLEGWNKGLRF